MKLAKIKPSKKFMEVLSNEEFPILRMYLSWLKRDGDCFISEIRDEELNFKLIIKDYCFNEPESERFWKELEGSLTWDIIKVIEL